MNELDVLDIELLYSLVDDEICRSIKDTDRTLVSNERRLFELRLLQHKLEVMRRNVR